MTNDLRNEIAQIIHECDMHNDSFRDIADAILAKLNTDALIVAALEAAAVFIKDNGSVMFTGRASDFVQTRTRTPEELMGMIRALAADPEAIAAIKAKAGWSE